MNYISSLRASVLDAVFFSVMFGFGESFISAYGIFLGASPLQVGLLASLPLLMGAISQLVGVFLMDRGIKRKSIVVWGTVLQALTWIPIGSLCLLGGKDIDLASILIGLTVTYFILGFLVTPVWTSLLGDLVPPEIRGRYFGKRNRIAGTTLLLSLLLAGFLLRAGEANGVKSQVFVFLFFSAGFARLISSYFLSKHEDLPYEFDRKDYFSFWRFIKQSHRSNFGKFVLYHAGVHLAVFLAGPYFIIYMLKELGFSYFEYTIVIAAALISNISMMQVWGIFGDRYGNKRILTVCGVLLVIVPTLWVFSSSIYYLLVVQLLSGFCWSGFQLGASNFLLDAVTREKRGRCTAYLWLPTATAICLGSLIGGFLLRDENSWFLSNFTFGLIESKYLSLFVFSGCMRAIVVLLMLPKFREVKEVEMLPAFFRITNVHPLMGSTVRIATASYRGPRNMLRNYHALRAKIHKERQDQTQK